MIFAPLSGLSASYSLPPLSNAPFGPVSGHNSDEKKKIVSTVVIGLH